MGGSSGYKNNDIKRDNLQDLPSIGLPNKFKIRIIIRRPRVILPNYTTLFLLTLTRNINIERARECFTTDIPATRESHTTVVLRKRRQGNYSTPELPAYCTRKYS